MPENDVKMMTKILPLLLIPILLVAFWLRLHDLDQFPPGISNDEAVNVVDAFHIHRTGVAPAYEDKGRPEPTYRIITGIGMMLFGDTVWAARFTGVLTNMLTLAAIYRLTCESFYDTGRINRKLGGVLAVIVISIMVGHITFSRALYRAIPQVLFVALSAAFVLRGLRTDKWRDFALAGVFAALALYTYTAAYFYLPALAVLGLMLFVLRFRAWQIWLPRLVLAASVLLVLTLPLAYLFLTNPEAILGRAQDVASSRGYNWMGAFRGMVDQFLRMGDENPQYNAALAPVIPPIIKYVFYLGLAALLVRLHKPSLWFLAAMLVLFSLPAIVTNELTHGLRISSEYIVVPAIIGGGVATLFSLIPVNRWSKLRWLAPIAGVMMLIVLGVGSNQAWQAYRDYWLFPDRWKMWEIFDYRLDHNEWFFRTDRRDFAAWITAQDQPLLLPIEELNRQTTRSWLLRDFPEVRTASANIVLPENTMLVVPWELGRNDLMRHTRHYALLQDRAIVILPPLSQSSHQTLLDDIESGERISGRGPLLDFLGYAKPAPDAFALDFEETARQGTSEPLAEFGDGEVLLTGWYGPELITPDMESLQFTLIWDTSKTLRHEYATYLQLQTQDFQRIAGDEDFILRWLYPTTYWRREQRVPDVHQFTIPDGLAIGAYRLVTGLYYTNHPPLSAMSRVAESVDGSATIGWLKIPAPTIEISPNAVPVDAIIDGKISLSHVEAAILDSNQVLLRLYWRSLVERPQFDGTIFVHLLDQEGQIIVQNDTRPWGGQYPTFIWGKDEVIMTEHLLTHEAVDDAELSLRTGMYTFPGPTNLPVAVDGVEVQNGLIELGGLERYLGESD